MAYLHINSEILNANIHLRKFSYSGGNNDYILSDDYGHLTLNENKMIIPEQNELFEKSFKSVYIK